MSSGTSTENFLLNIQAFPPRRAGNTFLRKTHFRDVILLTNCFSLSVCSNYRSLDGIWARTEVAAGISDKINSLKGTAASCSGCWVQ